MCNIAGYIGAKRAAPILCEMMKRQEGYGGGYYTGITTHDGTKLNNVKVVGDMSDFLNETDGINFEGNMGFIHSRSKSGGDVRWGHPFVTSDNSLSYIANGAIGRFMSDEMAQIRRQAVEFLEKEGFDFPSRTPGAIGDYPYLSDGTAIHMSDLVCQYVSYYIKSGKAPDEAMSLVNSKLNSEVVGLIITQDVPDKIYITRINFPMMIGISSDGDTYLATTALAFPDDVKFEKIELLPAGKTFEVFRGGYRVSPYKVDVPQIQDITPEIMDKSYKILEALLTDKQNEPVAVQDCIDACEGVWDKALVPQGPPLVYEIMRKFRDEGRLGISLCPVEGAFDGYTTNNFRIYLK